jgi:hypothetical protein
MHVRKGRKAASAVNAISGVCNGRIDRNGDNMDGVEGCNEL